MVVSANVAVNANSIKTVINSLPIVTSTAVYKKKVLLAAFISCFYYLKGY
ncbi:hypothetical protein FM106_07445 [Brachybacterium faecium]|nr:hypothetical protein FM106_07445 [Brachybacterium faecium]